MKPLAYFSAWLFAFASVTLLSGCPNMDAASADCVTGQPVFIGSAPFAVLQLRSGDRVYRLDFEGSSAKMYADKLKARQGMTTRICGFLKQDPATHAMTLIVQSIE